MNDLKRKEKETFYVRGIKFVVYHVEGTKTVVVKPTYEKMWLLNDYPVRIDLRNITGKSVCSEQDEFNFNKGVQIATYRALCEIRNRVNNSFKHIQKDVDNFNSFVTKRKLSLNQK